MKGDENGFEFSDPPLTGNVLSKKSVGIQNQWKCTTIVC